MHVQTINHKDASVEKKRNAKLKQSKVNENKPNDKPFFLFFQLCVCVCVCVCWLLSLVQSSPAPPFNKKRLMVGLILIRQLGWGGLNFLVYYLYSNYSPTTQLFYLTSPQFPPNSQFPIGLNYCKKKEKRIFWRV